VSSNGEAAKCSPAGDAAPAEAFNSPDIIDLEAMAQDLVGYSTVPRGLAKVLALATDQLIIKEKGPWLFFERTRLRTLSDLPLTFSGTLPLTPGPR